MDQNEPRAEDVGDVVEEVGVGNTIESGVARKAEEEDVGEVAESVTMCQLHTLEYKHEGCCDARTYCLPLAPFGRYSRFRPGR